MASKNKPAKNHIYTWTLLLTGDSEHRIKAVYEYLTTQLDIDQEEIHTCSGLDVWEIEFDWMARAADDGGFSLFIRTNVGKKNLEKARDLAFSFLEGWKAAKKLL